MRRIKFSVPGKPVSMQRPRINMRAVKRWLAVKMRGNPYRFGPLVYTPSPAKTYQRKVLKCAPKVHLKGELQVYITLHLKRPKNMTVNSLRPDIDNYAKNILDGLQGGPYLDDAWVSVLYLKKTWVPTKEQERAVITIIGR